MIGKYWKYGVPEESDLGPILFTLFINVLHKAVKISLVYYFTDGTNFILIDNSLKMINKNINRDLKLIVEWIKANKLSLDTIKTELVLFKSRKKYY